jgi:hypothetical protein
MKNWLLPAAVVGLAVALAYLVWVSRYQPRFLDPSDYHSGVTHPPPAPPAPAALPAVVDVLDIDPLLDPPAGGAADPVPAGPVVTAFGDDPVPQPVRPASVVAPIPHAGDESVSVEVAPMPREVKTETSFDDRDPVARLAGCFDPTNPELPEPTTGPYGPAPSDLEFRGLVDSTGRITGVPGHFITGAGMPHSSDMMETATLSRTRKLGLRPDQAGESILIRLAFTTPARPPAEWCRRGWYGNERLPRQLGGEKVVAKHDSDLRPVGSGIGLFF